MLARFNTLLLLFSLLYCQLISAQEKTDSLLFFHELKFDSQIELKSLQGLTSGNENQLFQAFAHAGASYSEESIDSYHQHFYNHLRLIEPKVASIKNNSKKVKYIFKSVHDTFFTKYQLINHFGEIFTTGNYNCVSASALYAMAFDYYKIPYSIKETPTHVYLVAFPDTDKILVESTDPAGKYFTMNNKFKQEYVTQLRLNKLISEAEFRSSTINDLFDQYYFSKENITLTQLVGIQYSNDGFYELEKLNYSRASEQLAKAFYLHPSAKSRYGFMFTLGSQLDKQDYSSFEYIKSLAILARFVAFEITRDNIIEEFGRITQLQLYHKESIETYDKSYSYLNATIKDDTLRKEIEFIYNYEKAVYYREINNFKKAIPLAETAYKLKPDYYSAKKLFSELIILQMMGRNDFPVIHETLNEYQTNFSFLTTDNRFLETKLRVILGNFAIAYETGKIKDGEKFRILFEEIYDEELYEGIEKQLIGRAYSLAAMHYYRQNNLSKTKQLLKKGLEYAPYHQELLRRMEIINRQ